jgi:hypothetical protein
VTLVDGKLSFPPAPNVPGAYRFTLVDADGERTGVYVGEADLLRRRFQHYRTPGPRQRTNLRLNAILIDTLARGGQVNVEIATSVRGASEDGKPSELDLSWKASRVLVERAAEVIERQDGSPVLNL